MSNAYLRTIFKWNRCQLFSCVSGRQTHVHTASTSTCIVSHNLKVSPMSRKGFLQSAQTVTMVLEMQKTMQTCRFRVQEEPKVVIIG
jgi:hypothetical protein